jgi:choice-of-anchor A domain-containing protein
MGQRFPQQDRPMRRAWHAPSLAIAFCIVAASGMVFPQQDLTAEAAVTAVNPVTLDRRANSGFLVLANGDVTVGPGVDESEGTIAAAGTLRFRQPYNVGAGSVPPPTFRSPGDAHDTYLFAGAGVDWGGSSSALNVANGGYTKLGGAAGAWSVLHKNPNSYQVVPAGVTDPDATPRIASDVVNQSASSISDLRGAPDVAGAFAEYRPLSQQIGACTATDVLYSSPSSSSAVVPRPIASRTPQVYVDLVPGQTNFLRFTPAELANIDQIGLLNGQSLSASTPLVITVTGTAFSGTIPRQGWPEGQSPFALWNFPGAASVTVTGNTAELNGTLYAPSAAVTWAQTQNLSGNVVAASFTHGAATVPGAPRELHDYAFAAQVSCTEVPSSTVTLQKVVVGSDEQPSSWTLTALGPDGNVAASGRSGEASVRAVPVVPGEYQLTESGPARFRSDGWECEAAGAPVPVAANGVVDIPPGADVVCAVTNVADAVTATGTLTLRKAVIDAPFGSYPPTDWVLTASGDPQSISGRTGETAITGRELAAGTYTLREDGPAEDFATDGWDCGDEVMPDSTSVVIGAGADVTCTVTNTFIATPAPTPTPTPTVLPVPVTPAAPTGAAAFGGDQSGDPSAGRLAFTGVGPLLPVIAVGGSALIVGIVLKGCGRGRKRSRDAHR